MLLLCGYALAEEEIAFTGEQRIAGAGTFGVPLSFRIDASAAHYTYTLSSSELSFVEDETVQTFDVELTDCLLFGRDILRVSTLPFGELSTQDGKMLPFAVIPAPQAASDPDPSGQDELPVAEENADPETPVFFDFDEEGRLSVGIALLTPWAEIESGSYEGDALFTIAPYSEDGRDYAETPAAPQEFIVHISAVCEKHTVTVHVGEGGGIIIDPESMEVLRPTEDEPLELLLGNTETAALIIAPDTGYEPGEVIAVPDGCTRLEENSLIFENITADTNVIITFRAIPVTLTLDAHLRELQPGQEATLSATIAPDFAAEKPLAWSSSNAELVTVDQVGVITIPESGEACGTATIRCALSEDDTVYDECAVIVHSAAPMKLPASLKVIGEEAFAGSAAKEFILPEGVLSIGSRAFANGGMLLVSLPDSLTSIEADAFDGCTQLTILCSEGSIGEAFAIEHGLNYLIRE